MAEYKVNFLGTAGYEGIENEQYGDCVALVNEAKKHMVIYDCGSEQHAEKIIEFMNAKKITTTDIILSHNDSDHFDGIPKLIAEGKVGKIFTTLLLKYVDDILDKLDNRHTRKATKEHILDLYSNIAQLSGSDLKDIYEHGAELPAGISFIGPDLDSMMTAVAKAVKNRDTSKQIDGETIVNATSLQIAVDVLGGRKLLLLGDTSVKNVTCNLKDYRYIHLPHHGKLTSAEAIFDKISADKSDNIGNHTFIISDNTGTTIGGSDALMASAIRKGKDIKNTKTDGNIEFGVRIYSTASSARDNYGLCFGL